MRTGIVTNTCAPLRPNTWPNPARRELLRLALDEELPARHDRASDACQPPEQRPQQDRREQRQADGGQPGPCIARLFEFAQRQLETLRGRAGHLRRRVRRVWVQVGHQDPKRESPIDHDGRAFRNLLARDDQLAAAVDDFADALLCGRCARRRPEIEDIGAERRDVAVCDLDIGG